MLCEMNAKCDNIMICSDECNVIIDNQLNARFLLNMIIISISGKQFMYVYV